MATKYYDIFNIKIDLAEMTLDEWEIWIPLEHMKKIALSKDVGDYGISGYLVPLGKDQKYGNFSFIEYVCKACLSDDGPLLSDLKYFKYNMKRVYSFGEIEKECLMGMKIKKFEVIEALHFGNGNDYYTFVHCLDYFRFIHAWGS